MKTKNYFFCAFLLLASTFLSFGQQKITFKSVKIPESKTPVGHLFLAGNFNGWNPADKAWELSPDSAGTFNIVKDLPAGIYHFKLTKGSWENVECTAAGKPVENRDISVIHDTTILLTVAGWQDNFAVIARTHTASPQVHIMTEKFNMPQLGRTRRIWIYLPADYRSAKKRFPVIYMHDGQNLFDEFTSGYGEWGVDELLDNMQIDKESIVVGIDHGGEYRITEYDPYDSKYGKGRGDDYVSFLIKILKPYIDQHYRTKPAAKYTTIAGSSMGGLISMYAALKYPNVFGNAGIFSTAFWIAPEVYELARQKSSAIQSRFYFVCGDAESDSMVADMKKMADLIRTGGVSEKNSPIVIIKGASHNEKQWHGDFPDFYKWLYAF